MTDITLATRLIETLPYGIPELFNPWKDACAGDTALNGQENRLGRLAQHLACEPKFILVGEAAGYQGMRRSALAFTSERQLLEGAIPRVSRPSGRLTLRRLPYSEPSATIVWGALKRLGIAEHTILWNALPLHPFKPGAFDSNRTPTDAELMLGSPAMRMLADAFPQAIIVAVGRKSETLLGLMGIVPARAVRHPANGGATAFREGLAELVAQQARMS